MNTNRIVRLVLLMALMLAVAGCGAGTPAPTPTTVTSPQPTATTATADSPTSTTAAALPTATTAAPAEMRTVRVGYIPGPAPATHLWLGLEKGYFEEEGLKVEATRFNTGISLSNALTGGSLDMGVMGPVIANFPSRGQGKIFLINSIEKNIHQLWVDPAAGINTVADLAGKNIATTSGTAAHMFLLVALREAGVDPDSVQIVNSDIAAATNAFISGAVPAVSLWAPFDAQVKEQRPEAKMIDSAINYYPDKLAIVGGWVANNDLYEQSPEVLEAVSRAWMKANTDIVNDPAGSMEIAHRQAADLMSLEQYKAIFEAAGWLTNEEWNKNFSDGTALKWVGDLEQLFVDMGALPNFVDPKTYFDTSIYTKVYEDTNP